MMIQILNDLINNTDCFGFVFFCTVSSVSSESSIFSSLKVRVYFVSFLCKTGAVLPVYSHLIFRFCKLNPTDPLRGYGSH